LPLCHIFERMAGLYAMMSAGISIAYAENMDSVGANAVEVRPTILSGVPRFYEKVHDRVIDAARDFHGLRRSLFHWGIEVGRRKARAHFERRALDPITALQAALADRLVASKIRERVGGRIRFCISGGAPLAAEVMEFFFAVGIPIIEGYGLTETSPVICLNPLGKEKPGTVGPPIPGVEVRIGEDGEILTRGQHVMRGYFHNDAATTAAVTDGWFHTGDVGRMDDERYLTITDRLKDLLVTAGGKKVAPQPLEAKLKTSRWISEAVLLGDRRPYVIALLVPNFAALEAEAKARGWSFTPQGSELERPEVQALFRGVVDQLNADLAPFERIKYFALLQRELTQDSGELTPTLKVKRRVIMERYAGIIERLYASHVSGAAAS
jgi:long-chain acyl-CoA synthetase